MKVKIEVMQRESNGSLASMAIEGTITPTSTLTHKEVASLLFQMEWTLNSHAPGMRVHIGLEPESA